VSADVTAPGPSSSIQRCAILARFRLDTSRHMARAISATRSVGTISRILVTRSSLPSYNYRSVVAKHQMRNTTMVWMWQRSSTKTAAMLPRSVNLGLAWGVLMLAPPQGAAPHRSNCAKYDGPSQRRRHSPPTYHHGSTAPAAPGFRNPVAYLHTPPALAGLSRQPRLVSILLRWRPCRTLLPDDRGCALSAGCGLCTAPLAEGLKTPGGSQGQVKAAHSKRMTGPAKAAQERERLAKLGGAHQKK
jgi:hypothetical protein